MQEFAAEGRWSRMMADAPAGGDGGLGPCDGRAPACGFLLVYTCFDLRNSAWALFLTESSVSATFEEPGNYKLCKNLGG